ncbi:hypothetical protein HPT29_004560 [Microvirga terrae]|uniref:Cadherin domain-containing protein n=1 Tax=Microvirga terrae TaxID=2740529 RepID=A0ABY5RW49_9HYPH|nr:hypothetical protein [Microvirga terrae]UVF20427.1 hypothetical protein HPT29_004560 [Microvirga terrae]
MAADIEKIIGTNRDQKNQGGNDQFWIETQYDSAQKSWQWFGMAGSDDLKAGLGNDTLDGGWDADGLQGGDGDDVLFASQGFNDNVRDVLWGGSGNDRLEGNSNDLLFGGDGNDTLIGGWAFYGDYTYTSAAGARFTFTYSTSVNLNVNLTTRKVTDGTYTDTLIDIWQVSTGNGSDTLTADSSSAWFNGGGGDDKFYGGAGNDTLIGGSGFDFFYGSAGSDLIDGDVDGGVVDYVSLGGSVKINLATQKAVKTIGSTTATDDVKNIDHAQGTNQSDEILGNANANHLLGADGDDYLFGDKGNDSLEGGEGKDKLSGGDHNDSLYGGNGDDQLFGDVGIDSMVGGNGDDEYWVDNDGDVVVEVITGGAKDLIHTTIDYNLGAKAGFVENLKAEGTANVKLTGNAGNNILTGNSGNNEFEGGGGVDTMIGGLGDDTYHIRNIDDDPREFRTTIEGAHDTAYIYVANFDGRKLANIEHVFTRGAGSVDYGPDKPVVIRGSSSIDENLTGFVAQVWARDPDNVGGPLKYELLTHQDKFSIDPDSGDIALKTKIDFEDPFSGLLTDGQGRKYFVVDVRAVETSGGKYSSQESFKIYINGVDEAPSAPQYSGKPTFLENKPIAGSLVTLGGALDPEQGNVVTYALATDADANPGGLFVVSANGAITLAQPNGSLDYEASSIVKDGAERYFIVKVVAKDPAGNQSAVTPVKIYVTNDDEEPSIPSYSGKPTVVENTVPTQPIVQLSSVDPEGDPVTFSLAQVPDANPNNRFLVSADGKITLAPNVTLDYEAADLNEDPFDGGKYYVVRVVASDGKNHGSSIKDVRIYVSPVDEAPSIPNDPGPQTWAEGTGPGVTLAQVRGSIDPEQMNVNYHLSSAGDANPGNRFQVSLDGKITLAPTKTLDYEAADLRQDTPNGPKYYIVKVVAKDPAGNSSAERLVKIFVTNVDEAPNAPTPGLSASWTENVVPSAALLTVTGSVDPENAAVSYDFDTAADANPGGLFVIAADGKITLNPTKTLDYEAQELKDDKDGKGKYYALKVVAKDQSGHASTPTIVKIYVTDDNDLPTGIQFKDAPPEVVIGMGAGSPIIRAEAIDPDRNNGNNNSNFLKNRYKFADGSLEFGKFKINAETGEITLKEALTPLDAHQHTLTVITYDEGQPAAFVTATYQFTVQSASSPYIWTQDPETDVADNGIASPFTSIMVSDANRAGLYLEIRFDPTEGRLDLSELSIMYDAWEYDEAAGVLKLKGSMQDIISALPHVRFNPNDRPDGEVGNSLKTTFHMALVDEATGAEIATNDTVAVNSIVANRDPTISGGGDDLSIADNETVNLVTPFTNVTIGDTNANDFITVTITAGGDHGGAFIDANGNIFTGTYTFGGSVQDVLDAVRALKFNPTDRHGVAAGTTDVVTFEIKVQDNAGALVSYDPNITVKSVVANRAPDLIGWAGGMIPMVNDDIGAYQFIGQLSAYDDNGDPIVEYVLDEDLADKFYIMREGDVWNVYVKDALDFANAPHEGNGLKWYEIKVKASDGRAWSTPQVLQIFVQDVDNIAPVILVDPNGKTEWPVEDSDTVAPFQDLTFFDEDDASILVNITLNTLNGGAFICPDDDDFPDLTIFKTDENVTVIGNQALITAYIKLLAFNPANNLGPLGSVVPIDFSVTAQDESTYTTRHVTVNATVTGGPDDVAPTIIVDPLRAVTKTTDWAADPVNPFLGVTLEDTDSGSEILTLKISFDSREGLLNGDAPGIGGTFVKDDAAHRITWTFEGTLTALRVILGQLTFNASEQPAQSPVPIITTFTITLDDHHHAFPAANQDVKVETTVTGPPAGDEAPTIGGLPAAAIEATANSGTVAPFGSVTIGNEVGQATTATITFLNILGELTGNGLTPGGVDGNGIVTYTVTGTDAINLQALLRGLSFNPRQLAMGASENVVFTVKVTDSGHPTANVDQTGTVTVHSAAGNEDPGDDVPTIGGLGTVDADANSGTVAPFGSVLIDNDDGQWTMATITFREDLGDLVGDHLILVGTDGNGISTYTVTGTDAADLQTKLRALSFDPRPLNAGQFEDIAFNVTLTDFTHPTDGLGQSGTATVHSVAAGGPNTAPTGIVLSQNIVREFSESLITPVGEITVVDPGDTGPWDVQMIDNADGRFALEGSRTTGWRIIVADGLKLDFEQDVSHLITLKVTDSNGATSELIEVRIFVENMLFESVVGNDDANTIIGGGQDDNLSGGGGDDILHGGGGADVLNGGDGADTFVFDAPLDPLNPVDIQDFDPTQDRIQLSSAIFQELIAGLDGTVDPLVFYAGSDPVGDFQLLYDETSGALVYDPDGFSGEAAPSIVIAILSNVPSGFQLTHEHFIII